MKPERWHEIERLYHSALEREASQRAAFLGEACRGDEDLRREVESLLAQQPDAPDFLGSPGGKVQAEDPSRSLVGQQIGSYKVLSLLGAGGMGQVYRARDAKLGRDVAIKVLPREFASDLERVRRFEQEARAASALNHPNIITIHEISQVDAVPYLVMELVEGKTLREVLSSGPVPTKRLLQLVTQVADGLAQAHAAGITHRDLKPENLMVTKEGLVKILDFGLAKQARLGREKEKGSEVVTLTEGTEPGLLIGTVGYMSPEQAKGHAVSFQSDQFSFGAIVYEMATGKRAFARSSAAETLAAIIREEPKALAELSPKTPPHLRWITERCLAKEVEARYASTRDLALELQSVRDHLSESGGAGLGVGSAPMGVRHFRVIGAITLAIAVLTVLAFYAGENVGSKRIPSPSGPTFHQLTFRHGNITGARFAPDGQTVIYGATWAGKPSELFTTRPESPDSRALGLHDAGIFSISSSGEMAVALGCVMNWGDCMGRLAEASLNGGAPHELMENVLSADWAPDGKTLAVVRRTEERVRLEYPVGKVLYETPGWIAYPYFSPKGDLVAFQDHPTLKSSYGSVCVVDLSGKKRELSTGWKSLFGLAWSVDGNEIWFSGSHAGKSTGQGLYAVTLSGQERLLLESPSQLGIRDISRDGRRVLLKRTNAHSEIIGFTPGAPKERDLSWFDFSTAADLSADGKNLLFYEWGEGVRGALIVYLRRTDDSDAVRLGEGKPLALSPDGKWALAVQETSPPQLVLLPTGPGEQKSLPRGPIQEYKHWAAWFPDGSRIFFSGSEAGHRPRTYVQDIGGGEPHAVTSEAMTGVLLSPDGKLIAAIDRYREYYLCPVGGGEPRAIEGLEDGDTLLQWSADGRSLFVRAAADLVLKIYKLDLSSGRRQLWKELTPPDPAALIGIGEDPGETCLTPDGKYYVYTYWTAPSELYVVEGLK